jgi:hypothetical protein
VSDVVRRERILDGMQRYWKSYDRTLSLLEIRVGNGA